MPSIDFNRWKAFCIPHVLNYILLSMTATCLLILTIAFGTLWRDCLTSSNNLRIKYSVENEIIGFPNRFLNDERYVHWIFLHMNDIYELLPLGREQNGGVPRVAYIRQLLKQENPNTYTILAGDLLFPSALGSSKVNGAPLNGRQMIATMNSLGLDFMIFGNNEFGLTESELLARMNESTFPWINSNVFHVNSTQLFGATISHKLLTIDTVRILLFGLTIDKNISYVDIINQSSLIPYVQQFLHSFPNGTYDVLVAITHLKMSVDIQLAQKIPQIDLILGGHEHENYYYLRGTKYTPIYKADSNAFTVYVHRCAFNIDTKRFRIYSTLVRVTPQIPEEPKTAAVANYWFNLGIQGFEALGFKPNEIVSCLPIDIELDGRYESIRTSAVLLTNLICESMLQVTASMGTTIAIFNTGVIRIDDILRETITQYDILRTLPIPNYILALSVPGQLLARVLSTGMSAKGTGSFLSYIGIETLDGGIKWLVNGTDISTSGLNYTVATIERAKIITELKSADAVVLQNFNVTQTQSLIDYLKTKYSPC